ncbi:MAG: hypothetical protein ACOYD7_04545 [Raoultibacter sp.]|jgi:hypothetical protein
MCIDEEKQNNSEEVTSATQAAKAKPAAQAKLSLNETKPQSNPYARAANEDDDGYDPWSDRKAVDPLWEEDPWK